MLKILIKLWPALIPIALYLLWIFMVGKFSVKKKKKIIEGEFGVVGEGEALDDGKKNGNFSLENRFFLFIVYFSLILAIVTLILAAFSS